MKKSEYLVTGQGYEISDAYKQTILLHDTFMATDEKNATELFNERFSITHKIIKVYSAENIANN